MGLTSFIYNPLTIGSAGSSGLPTDGSSYSYGFNLVLPITSPDTSTDFNNTLNELTIYNDVNYSSGFTSMTGNPSRNFYFSSPDVNETWKLRIYSDQTLLAYLRLDAINNGLGICGITLPDFPFKNMRVTAQPFNLTAVQKRFQTWNLKYRMAQ